MQEYTSNVVNTTWNGSSGPNQWLKLSVNLSDGNFVYTLVPYTNSGEWTNIYGLTINIGGNNINVGDITYSGYTPGTAIRSGSIPLVNCAVNSGVVSMSAYCNFRVGTWNSAYKATASGTYAVEFPRNVTLSYTAANTYSNVIVGGGSTLSFSFSATPGTSGNTISEYRLYQNNALVYSGATASATITASAGTNSYYVVAVESNGATGQSSEVSITAATYTPPAFESVSSIRWAPTPGKNRYNPNGNPIEQGAIASANGVDTTSSTRVRTHGYIEVSSSTTYTLSTNVAKVFVLQYGENENYLNVSSGWQNSPYTFTTGANTYNLRLVFAKANDGAIEPEDIEWIQLEQGSSATDWEPYSDNGAPSDDGEYANLSAAFIPAKISGIEPPEIPTTCRMSIVGIGTIGTITTSGDSVISGEVLSPESSYTVVFELYDGQFTTSNAPVVRTDTITIGGRGIDLVHFGSNYGVAVGTKATAGYLDTAYPFRIKTIDANGNVADMAEMQSSPVQQTVTLTRFSGLAVHTVTLYTFGRVAFLTIRFTPSANYSAGDNIFVGSLSAFRPKEIAMGGGYYASGSYSGLLDSAGSLTLRATSYLSTSGGGSLHISFTYLF